MNIRFLGAHNTVSKNTKLVSFMIDDVIAVDAGSLTSELDFSEQKKIKAIFLSHGHYDHIRGVPSFAFSNPNQTTLVYSTSHTLEILTTHLFDGVIYPKLNEKTPFLEKPPLKLVPVKTNNSVELNGYHVKAFLVNHTIETVGYEITSKDGKKIFYTGDTGPNLSEIWHQISPDLIIIDATFPNRLEKTAVDSKHLCPKMIKKELLEFKKIKKYLPKIVLIHLSPKYEDEIKKEAKEIAKELKISIDFASEGKEITI